ncbi:MAG: Holliday junction resolvase RuvX [Parcubacteria group bacterium]|nr:Holliday junction resolvase RuvX [Parcubacteria group bacterium]
MRFLGIDYGEKRIGIALSDENGMLAFPHSILNNDARLIKSIHDICKQESVSQIVIGESRMYGGTENPVMKKIADFKERLQKTTSLPIAFESEVLTSQEARRSREKESNVPVDDSAAAIILQSFLDKRKYNNGK